MPPTESTLHAADVVAANRVLAARVRSAVARLRFHAEGDRRRGVVEVAQVLDVEAVVAVRVERPGALEMRRHVVAAVADGFCSSTSSLRRSWRGRARRCPRRSPASVSARRHSSSGPAAFRLPATEQSQLLPTALPTVVLPRLVSVSPRSKQYDHLAQRRRVAERRVARPSSAAVACRCRRHLAGDHRHRGVLVTGDDRLHADEQRACSSAPPDTR